MLADSLPRGRHKRQGLPAGCPSSPNAQVRRRASASLSSWWAEMAKSKYQLGSACCQPSCLVATVPQQAKDVQAVVVKMTALPQTEVGEAVMVNKKVAEQMASGYFHVSTLGPKQAQMLRRLEEKTRLQEWHNFWEQLLASHASCWAHARINSKPNSSKLTAGAAPSQHLRRTAAVAPA